VANEIEHMVRDVLGCLAVQLYVSRQVHRSRQWPRLTLDTPTERFPRDRFWRRVCQSKIAGDLTRFNCEPGGNSRLRTKSKLDVSVLSKSCKKKPLTV
jgi:hypothetical protein